MSDRVSGTVKWFSAERGFGFILMDGDSDQHEYFVHHTYIEMDGYRTLKAGQAVSFVPTETDKGIQAKSVSLEE